MEVRLHQHAQARIAERGATQLEVIETVRSGERSEAKHGRFRFRRNFTYNEQWRGRTFATKQIEAIAVEQNDGAWLVITVLVKFF